MVAVTNAGALIKDSAMEQLSVSEAARRLGARPRDISDLFYRRQLSDERCPIVGGRRLIPENYVHRIAAALRRAGRPVAQDIAPTQKPTDDMQNSINTRERKGGCV